MPSFLTRSRDVRVLDVLLIVGVLFVLWAIVSTLMPSPPDGPPATVPVQRGTVVSTVSADGNVEPPQDLSLAFERGGRLSAVYVEEGDRVRRGQPLARLEDRSARAQLVAARADVASAEARLRDTRLGNTIAELAENRAMADRSRAAIRNAEREVGNARRVGKTNVATLRRAVARAQVGGQEADLRASELRLSQEQGQIGELERRDAELNQQVDRLRDDLNDAYERQRDEDEREDRDNDDDNDDPLGGLDFGGGGFDDNADIAILQNKLADAEREEQNVRSDLETARANVRTYVADVQRDRSALRDARRQLGDARDELSNGLTGAQQQIDEARNSLRTSEAELDVTLAENRVDEQGPEAADLASDLSGVAAAQATLADAEKTVEDTVLRAPADGVVGNVDAEVGELVGSGGLSSGLGTGTSGSDAEDGGGGGADGATGAQAGGSSGAGATGDESSASGNVITLAGVQTLQIEVGFDETDAARLSVGDTATISVDALPEQEFAAHVASIDPVETVVSNVVTYDVTLLLDSPPTNLKPGMTATAEVMVDEANEVLTLPKSAVRSPPGAAPTVTVVHRDGTSEPRLVVTGIEGDDRVQIVGGVGVGDRVVRSAETPPTAAPAGP